MQIRHFIRVLILAACGAGCVQLDAPKNDLGFSKAANLSDFAGCYANKGEGESSDTLYLSSVVWSDANFKHKEIKAIRFAFEAPSKLLLTVETGLGQQQQKALVARQDFHEKSGRIELKSAPIASLLYPGGNPALGAGYESVTLGTDPKGNLRLLNSDAFAGTAFIVIPMAVYSRTVFRFVRNPALCG